MSGRATKHEKGNTNKYIIFPDTQGIRLAFVTASSHWPGLESRSGGRNYTQHNQKKADSVSCCGGQS